MHNSYSVRPRLSQCFEQLKGGPSIHNQAGISGMISENVAVKQNSFKKRGSFEPTESPLRMGMTTLRKECQRNLPSFRALYTW